MSIPQFVGPPIVFRYRNDSEYTLDELTQSYIYFPDRSQLNDPFDCYPGLLKVSQSPDKLKKLANNLVLRDYKNLPRIERRKKMRELIEKPDLLRNGIHNNLISILNRFGIGCFTFTPSNLMMWSHYSNYHKGVCLQFDINKDKKFFNGLELVKYIDDFLIKEYFLDEDSDPLSHLFYTKSSVWSVEHELRLIKMTAGKYNFDKSALVGVIFGMKCEEAFIRKVLESSNNDNYPNLKFYTTEPSKNSFGLVFQEVKFEAK